MNNFADSGDIIRLRFIIGRAAYNYNVEIFKWGLKDILASSNSVEIEAACRTDSRLKYQIACGEIIMLIT